MDRTNAKRQARYREKMNGSGDFKRINYWVRADIADRVTMFATSLGWPKMKVIEAMVNGYRLPRVWARITKKTRMVKLRVKAVARP